MRSFAPSSLLLVLLASVASGAATGRVAGASAPGARVGGVPALSLDVGGSAVSLDSALRASLTASPSLPLPALELPRSVAPAAGVPSAVFARRLAEPAPEAAPAARAAKAPDVSALAQADGAAPAAGKERAEAPAERPLESQAAEHAAAFDGATARDGVPEPVFAAADGPAPRALDRRGKGWPGDSEPEPPPPPTLLQRLGRAPWVTALLVAANVAVFTLFGPASDPHSLSRLLGFAFDADKAIALLHHYTPDGLVTAVTTAFTAMYTHGNFDHIMGNMLVLGIFGGFVERWQGRGRFLFTYTAAGFAGMFAAALVGAGGLFYGASGAIAGIMVAYVLHGDFYRSIARRVKAAIRDAGTERYSSHFMAGALLSIVGLLALLMVSGEVSSLLKYGPVHEHVATIGHVGGFVAGLALSFLFGLQDRLNALFRRR